MHEIDVVIIRIHNTVGSKENPPPAAEHLCPVRNNTNATRTDIRPFQLFIIS